MNMYMDGPRHQTECRRKGGPPIIVTHSRLAVSLFLQLTFQRYKVSYTEPDICVVKARRGVSSPTGPTNTTTETTHSSSTHHF